MSEPSLTARRESAASGGEAAGRGDSDCARNSSVTRSRLAWTGSKQESSRGERLGVAMASSTSSMATSNTLRAACWEGGSALALSWSTNLDRARRASRSEDRMRVRSCCAMARGFEALEARGLSLDSGLTRGLLVLGLMLGFVMLAIPSVFLLCLRLLGVDA